MTSFVNQVIANAIRPPDNTTMADWLTDHFYSHIGQAFSVEQCPWVTAPQGPCWAYDEIQFQFIWLQWASRMFKTNFGLSTLLRSMSERPEETMFGTPDEGNCKTVFGRVWKMIDHSPALRALAPSSTRRNKTRIDLSQSVCHGAWPRGKSMFADKSIRIAHGNEIDKWVTEKTTTEGDPHGRFKKRGAEHPDRTFTMESTPSIEGRSVVEAGRLNSTNHRYNVPCPHCVKFQTINYGDKTRQPGMIHYDVPTNGRADIELARLTAHYVCRYCESRIDDIDRPWMMQNGVWVPAGCEVDHDRAMRARELPPDDMSWLIGTPTNWGRHYGSQISVFYALFHGWGDIVADFLERKRRSSTLQQWVNEDKGETWSAKKTTTKPDDIAERLANNVPRRTLPEWCRLVTVTIDQQEADGGFRVWGVMAHGPSERAHLVDVGSVADLADVWTEQVTTAYKHGDGGDPMAPDAVAIDSGWDTKATYDFCNEHDGCLPCKGSSTDIGAPYRLAPVADGKYKGQLLFTVNTDFWESELQARLDDRTPNDNDSLSLYAEIGVDVEVLEQLCNATIDSKPDRRGNTRLLWVMKDESIGNDFRDVVRYGLALAHAYVAENGWPDRIATASSRVVSNAGQSRPDGRKWNE